MLCLVGQRALCDRPAARGPARWMPGTPAPGPSSLRSSPAPKGPRPCPGRPRPPPPTAEPQSLRASIKEKVYRCARARSEGASGGASAGVGALPASQASVALPAPTSGRAGHGTLGRDRPASLRGGRRAGSRGGGGVCQVGCASPAPGLGGRGGGAGRNQVSGVEGGSLTTSCPRPSPPFQNGTRPSPFPERDPAPATREACGDWVRWGRTMEEKPFKVRTLPGPLPVSPQTHSTWALRSSHGRHPSSQQSPRGCPPTPRDPGLSLVLFFFLSF